MNEVAVLPAGEIQLFDPLQTKKRDAEADAVIEYAKRVLDWPLLERAVDTKIDEQEEFVGWWNGVVTPRLSNRKANRVLRLLSKDAAKKATGISQQQVSRWRRCLADREAYRGKIIAVTRKAALEETNDTTASKWTGNPESYTPREYIQSVYDVMGVIDVDPASNEFAQRTVQAGTYYTAQDDGLAKEWHGTVFLNPPYSHPEVAFFIGKLCVEFEAGRTTEAILLTNNNTDTRWWHLAAKVSSAACFTLGRINFYQEDGTITQPTNGQNFFYFGPGVCEFSEVFQRHGCVMAKHVA